LRVGAAMPAARPSDQRRGQLYARAARGLDADHEKQSVRRFRCRTNHPRLGAEEHLAPRRDGHPGLRQCSQGFPGGAARRSRRGLRAGSRGQVERRPRGPWSALRRAGYEPQRQSQPRRLPRVSQAGRARFRVRHQVRLGLRDLRAARVRRRDRRLAPAPALLRAAVSPEEAARLGAELTPLGGEKAGNADGSIPAWTGGLKSAAEAGFPNYHPGDHYPDPYANDKPLLTINSANLTQYAPKLTEGHKALFRKYADYKM